MICEHEGCACEATHFPRLMVPIANQPRDTTLPFGATVGIYLCLDHCKVFDFKGFIDPEKEQNLRDVFDMLAGYGFNCDYDQAFIHPMLLTEPEAIQLIHDIARSAHEHYDKPGHA